MSFVSKFKCVSILHLIFIGIIFLVLYYTFPSAFRCFCLTVGKLILLLLVTASSFGFTKKYFLNDRVRPENKAVFITGCDSGFGHSIAKCLDSKGYHVFAGCLFPSASGAQELRSECSSRLHIVELDITKEESVQNAFEFVKDKLLWLELWAVVNNAGVLKGLGVDFSTLQDFNFCIDVNVVGMIRITKAFLPLLKKSRGRVINVTSFSGRAALPGMAPYVTSKFAAVGFNDSLRRELDMWGIQVISVEPDGFRTPLTSPEVDNKLVDSTLAALDPEVREDYGKVYFEELKKLRRKYMDSASPKTYLVVDAVEEAVSSVHPDVIYRVAGNYLNKLFLDIYEMLTPTYQDMLIRIVTYGFVKPKRLQ